MSAVVSCIQQCFIRLAALNDRQVLPPQKICCDRNADGVLVIDGQEFLLESAVNNEAHFISDDAEPRCCSSTEARGKRKLAMCI